MNGTGHTTVRRGPTDRLLAQVRVGTDPCTAYVAGVRIVGQDRNDLTARLTTALYDFLHLRRLPRRRSAPEHRDSGMEDTVRRGLPHSVVLRRKRILDHGSGTVLLERGGVRVWTPDGRVRGGFDSPDGCTEVALPSSDAAVSPGYLMVESPQEPPSGAPALRFYANVRAPEHASEVLGRVLNTLEDRGEPYRAKVCTLPSEFPRADSLTVYLSEEQTYLAPELASALNGHPGVAGQTSLLALRLGEGTGLALEPTDPQARSRGLSFGLHRCSALAGALLEATAEGTEPRRLLEERFRAASIDPRHVWRDIGSPELPFVIPTGE